MPVTADDVRLRIAEILRLREARVAPDAVLTDLVTESFRLVEMAIELQEDYDVLSAKLTCATSGRLVTWPSSCGRASYLRDLQRAPHVALAKPAAAYSRPSGAATCCSWRGRVN